VAVGWALLAKVSVALAAPDDWGLKMTVKEALWPAGMVTGSERPLMLNAELLELAAVTVTLVPLTIRLADAVPLVPTTTLPKTRVVGVIVSCPAAAVPVPDNGIVSVGLVAFEVTVRLPLAVAADCGVNVTLKAALCPAVSVTGAVIPLTVNPVPLIPTWEMVTLDPPVLVTVSDADRLPPTVTLPKLRLVGFDPSAPGASPVPDKGMVKVGLVAFEVTVRLPLAIAADCGVNVTLKAALCPAVSVTGAVIPIRVNPVPLIPTWEMVTLDPPVLVTVSDADWLLPTVTLPKLRLVGFDPSTPGASPVPDKGMVKVGLVAFEVTVTLPLAFAADCGVNVILKAALCPAVSITGAVIALTVNPVPLIPTWEMVTLEPPVLVTVSDTDRLPPTVTLPKLRLVGFDPSAPGVSPVPDKGMVKVGLGAFEVTVTLPLAVAADCGVNVTLKAALWPAVSVTGAVIPLAVNPVPLIPTWEMVTLDPPVLVTVSDTDW
jgi:hypothetical protein